MQLGVKSANRNNPARVEPGSLWAALFNPCSVVQPLQRCSTLAGLFPIISPFSPHFMRGYSCSTLAGLFHDCANSQSDLDSNSCSTLAGLFPIISLFSPHFMRGYSCSTLFSVASPIGFQSICVHKIDFLNCQICMSQKNEGGATFPLCVRGYFAQRRVLHFFTGRSPGYPT